MVRRQGLLSLTGIALLGLIALMTLHEWDYSLPEAGRQRPDVPTMVLEGVRATSHQADGTPEFHVEAGSITFFEASQRSRLEDPRVSLYGRNGLWHVTARQGEMDQAQKRIELKGEVEANREGDDPVALSTGQLVYQVDQERLRSPGPVEIRHQGGATRAGRLEASLREGVLFMHDGVETRYVPASG